MTFHDLQRTDFGPFSSFADFVSPVTSRLGRVEARGVGAEGALAAFRQSIVDKLASGQDIAGAIAQTLNSPEGQAAMAVPDFPKSAQEFVDFIRPDPEETIKKSEIPKTTFEQLGKGTLRPEQEEFLGARVTPTAAEQITNAVIQAEQKGDKRRAELLLQQLPKAGNRIAVKEFIDLRAAGVEVPAANAPLGLAGLTPEKAQLAQALARAPKERAVSENELILRGLGQKVGTAADRIDPETAQAAVQIRQNLRKQQQNELLALIGAASGNTGLAEGFGQEEGVEDLFKRFNEGRGKAQEGGEAKGATTPPDLTAPTVGGAAGQAPGPTIDKGVAKTFEGMAPEKFATLDLNTLTTVVQAVVNKEIELSPEQRQALFDALKAQQGGSGAGAQ